jgi:hypothetical protein
LSIIAPDSLVFSRPIILWRYQFIKGLRRSFLKARCYVGIRVHRYLYRRMAQTLLDYFGVYSLLEHQTGVCVAYTVRPEILPRTQTAQRQVSKYQEGGMPFGLGYGAASNYPFDTSFISDRIILESD